VVWNQQLRGGLQMMILKELGERLREEGLWLAGGWGAHKSESLERGCEGSGRGGWCWEGPGVYCTVGDGAAKTQKMLPQEYTAVKDNLRMKRKGLGEGGVRTGLCGERVQGPKVEGLLFAAGSSEGRLFEGRVLRTLAAENAARMRFTKVGGTGVTIAAYNEHCSAPFF
jgi:hypothetical protein